MLLAAIIIAALVILLAVAGALMHEQADKIRRLKDEEE